MSERTEAIRDTLAGGPHDPAAAQAEARVHREEQIIAELEAPCRGCPGCSTGDCANVVDKAAARIAALEAENAELRGVLRGTVCLIGENLVMSPERPPEGETVEESARAILAHPGMAKLMRRLANLEALPPATEPAKGKEDGDAEIDEAVERARKAGRAAARHRSSATLDNTHYREAKGKETT